MIEANTPASRVIEIGAVRFDDDRVREQWTTFVNPGAPVPYAIQLLTGIDERTLMGAPTFEQVAPRLREFVGDDPVVGHSINIDLAHLAQQGARLANLPLDTFELAALMLPRLPAYDLAAVARELGITIAPSHRALADALCAREVFLLLLRRIRSLDLDVLMHINRVTMGLAWPLRGLFVEAEQARRQRLFVGHPDAADGASLELGLTQVLTPPDSTGEPLVPDARTKRLDVDALVQALRPGGPAAAALPNYEERPEQLAMLRAVCHAFDHGNHLIVEAGTGTGKSLAYLLPALAFAAANNRRVVVSTNTINLQDQLYEKDVPDLIRAMDYRARATVLKGRSNYVCLRRWLSLLRAESTSPEEATLLVKTLLWIRETRTGDRSELRLTAEEESAWSRICSQAELCSPLTCPYHREGSCFIARARRAADESHVVIVNHALLLSDLATRSRVIPEYDHLVVDEAHHLEDEATAQLGYSLAVRSFTQPLEALTGGSGRDGLGGIDLALIRLRAGGQPPARVAELAHQATALRAHARDAHEAAGALFGAVRELVSAHSSPGEFIPTLRITRPIRRDGPWTTVEQHWESLRTLLAAIREAIGPILEDLADAADANAEGMGEVLADLQGAMYELETGMEKMRAVVADPSPDTVCWATDQGFGAGPWGAGARPAPSTSSPAPGPVLHAAPIEVGSYLRTGLFDAKSTVVLTSATLSADGSFDYILDRLGAPGPRELALGSPFDYQRAALLFLPTDLPEPNEPGYARKAAEALADVAEALGGRTLALFTSYAQLRATRDMIRKRMDGAQIALMTQGIDGPRTRLLQRFKATERALLLGTASFWEGVDVVGEALSALVIARLPFAVPTDPVFAARSEQFEDSFRQYALPQAILRFKQGFGRLIRSQTDRGIVVVLDRRILSKGYGSAFLNSLPTCTVRTAPIEAVGPVAREWVLRAAKDRA